MKKILLTALLAFSTSAAYAQANFEGLYGQIGIGIETTSPTYTGSASYSGTPLTVTTSISNTTSFTGGLGVGYMGAINKSFLLGVGVDYSPFASQAGNVSATIGGVTASGTWRKQNSYNIFVSPATPIGANGLLYGKVGYVGASVQSVVAATTATENQTGYSLGLGYKHSINGGLYGFGEVNYYGISNKSTTTTVSSITSTSTKGGSSFTALVGVGYKF